MSGKQPKALWLAVHFDNFEVEGVMSTLAISEAAAELRRLHALNAELVEALRGLMVGCVYRSINGDAAWHEKSMPTNAALYAARAALAKAEAAQ